MDIARPYAAVCPSLDGDVLHTLAGTKMALTGRQVAALAGKRSHSGVLNVLHRLSEHGLVDRVELNRASLFSLNRAHVAAPVVEALAGLRGDVLTRIGHAIAAWEVAPVHASLFGSAARGDGDTHSDIDLFLVRQTAVDEEHAQWRDQVEALQESVQRMTGNRLAVLESSESEVARWHSDRPPIVASLREEAIVLHGPAVSELVGDE
jgi:predicted nucleotidyltransferase